jgi:hypothetical protein
LHQYFTYANWWIKLKVRLLGAKSLDATQKAAWFFINPRAPWNKKRNKKHNE